MADMSITASDVHLVSAGEATYVQFGEAVTAGMAVYMDTDDEMYYKADCDAVDTAVIAGVTITGGEANGWGYIATIRGQEIDIGGSVTVTQEYVVSDTAGLIMPASDLTTGQYYSLVGIGSTSTNMVLGLLATGIQHP